KAVARMLPELEKLLVEDFGDGKWHWISDLQRHVPPEMADAVGVRTETSGKDLCDETHPGAILLVSAAIDDLAAKGLCWSVTAARSIVSGGKLKRLSTGEERVRFISPQVLPKANMKTTQTAGAGGLGGQKPEESADMSEIVELPVKEVLPEVNTENT